MKLRSLLSALVLIHIGCAAADPASFDLTGPEIQVQVTRGGKTLPVSQVPNLSAGDRLWIRAGLPASQSEHYILVAAFLRGATNPPPESWFYRCDTWSSRCSDGLKVTVPGEAEQVLVFLAPQTSGDFRTLVDAVRGRPGAFVRASQDLNQASLDRSRLDAYLDVIHELNAEDPAKLKAVTPLLARSLAVKVDDKCLDKVPELQAPCLTQDQDNLILNDGHSVSMVEELTTGPASDLVLAASDAPQMGYGYYSPYISSIIDIGRIFDSFRTAKYQYLPALASPHGDRMLLTLNAAPSFHDPKSVLVTALPAIESPRLPPLHAVDPEQIFCARRDTLVLPVEGAPLVFSTGFVHDVTLSLTSSTGSTIDLPARADPKQGGFVVNTAALDKATLGDQVQASLHGWWGFDPYQAPTFHLVNARAQNWSIQGNDAQELTAGRDSTIHLTAASVDCVDDIMLKDSSGKRLKVEWRALRPDALELKLPLQEAEAGAATLEVSQFGSASQQVALNVADVPRPTVTILARSVKMARAGATRDIDLPGEGQLPEDAQLTFSVKALQPATFPRGQQVEIATADEAFSTVLSVANGGITLLDSRVAILRLDPAHAFGPSAFGPLRLRVISEDGLKGSWQPLTTLVRLPALQSLECAADEHQPCQLSGANLFLLDSVSADSSFDNPVTVPEGYPDDELAVPHPHGGRLYLRLRDDPGVTDVAKLEPQLLPAPQAAPQTPTSSQAPAQTAPSSAPPAAAPAAPAAAPSSQPVPVTAALQATPEKG